MTLLCYKVKKTYLAQRVGNYLYVPINMVSKNNHHFFDHSNFRLKFFKTFYMHKNDTQTGIQKEDHPHITSDLSWLFCIIYRNNHPWCPWNIGLFQETWVETVLGLSTKKVCRWTGPTILPVTSPRHPSKSPGRGLDSGDSRRDGEHLQGIQHRCRRDCSPDLRPFSL